MLIHSFFDPQKDHEKVDTDTVITVPDQSLSVRDILTRFSRGQMEIPPIDYGDDDDINAEVSDFVDIVDAHNTIMDSNNNLSRMQSEAQAKAEASAKRSEALAEASPTAEDSPS